MDCRAGLRLLTSRSQLVTWEGKLRFSLFSVIGIGLLLGSALRADEGMWVYNNLPTKALKDKYGFEAKPDWADHLMKSSVRFNVGGSGSFISSNGLILTNHHVAADALHKISDKTKDYHQDGFLAKTQAEEIPAKDLELNQLVSIEDVTKEVEASTVADMDVAAATAARRATIAKIEKDSFEKTGLRSDVVTLYQGGQYHLYRYKVYTDVRVVFAPEFQTAFLGGDPDNFEYPRYNLDMTIVRVYENGKPAVTPDFLKWSASGAKPDELVFVSGHPGSTNRLYTVDALTFYRDVQIPYTLRLLKRREVALQLYRQLGKEQERRAGDDFFGIQNSRKAYMGQQKGLLQLPIFADKQREEMKLRAQIAADPKLKEFEGAWDKIGQAKKVHAKLLKRRALLENGDAFNSRLFALARTLVRLADESAKPNGVRLPEFRDSNRSSLEQALYSEAEIYADLEVAMLTDSLNFLAEEFGYSHPLVQRLLSGRSPEEVAQYAVAKTQLFDVGSRRLIAKGGKAAIKGSLDPFIMMARLVDSASRAVRKEYEEKVGTVESLAYAQIAKALFAIKGTTVYPDATFSLRLAYGTVKEYTANGQKIAPLTTIGGAFDHEAKHGSLFPWTLPKSWHAAKGQMDLSTPLNFVATNDIIGGNSGSPVVNQAGELVGLIFDGNIQSLTSKYIYSDEISRAVAVHSSGMLEALKKVYGATALVAELGK